MYTLHINLKKPTQTFQSVAKPKVKQLLKEQTSHSLISKTQRMREEPFIIHSATPDHITVVLPVQETAPNVLRIHDTLQLKPKRTNAVGLGSRLTEI